MIEWASNGGDFIDHKEEKTLEDVWREEYPDTTPLMARGWTLDQIHDTDGWDWREGWFTHPRFVPTPAPAESIVEEGNWITIEYENPITWEVESTRIWQRIEGGASSIWIPNPEYVKWEKRRERSMAQSARDALQY